MEYEHVWKLPSDGGVFVPVNTLPSLLEGSRLARQAFGSSVDQDCMVRRTDAMSDEIGD